MTKPPPSNLGPMAEPWARWQTDQTVTNAEAIERLGGDASNDGRINNSTLDVMAEQINEIYQRQSAYTDAPSITTAPFNGTDTSAPTVAREIQLPRPTDAARSGWLAVSFDLTQSTADFSVAFFTLYVDGQIFHKNSVSFPTNPVTPAEWAASSNIVGFSGFTASPNSGGLVRIEMTPSANFASGSGLRTITATNFKVTHQYSQKV